MGVSEGRTTKFLPVIGAVVVASNPTLAGQSRAGGGFPAFNPHHIHHLAAYNIFFLHFTKVTLACDHYHWTHVSIIHLTSPFLWLLKFKCKNPVPFYCLISRTLDRVNLLGSFLGNCGENLEVLWESERVSYARCCGRRVPRCAARVVCCSLPTRPTRPAQHSSISRKLTLELSTCPSAWKGQRAV